MVQGPPKARCRCPELLKQAWITCEGSPRGGRAQGAWREVSSRVQAACARWLVMAVQRRRQRLRPCHAASVCCPPLPPPARTRRRRQPPCGGWLTRLTRLLLSLPFRCPLLAQRMDFYLDFHKHWLLVGPLVLYGRALLLDTPAIACSLLAQWRQCAALARPPQPAAAGL